jgi:hypothetical protein
MPTFGLAARQFRDHFVKLGETTVIKFALSGTSQLSARCVIGRKQQDAPVPIGPGAQML